MVTWTNRGLFFLISQKPGGRQPAVQRWIRDPGIFLLLPLWVFSCLSSCLPGQDPVVATAVPDILTLFKAGRRAEGEWIRECSRLLLTSHWPEWCHMTTSCGTGGCKCPFFKSEQVSSPCWMIGKKEENGNGQAVITVYHTLISNSQWYPLPNVKSLCGPRGGRSF